jgi:hypothetical protein
VGGGPFDGTGGQNSGGKAQGYHFEGELDGPFGTVRVTSSGTEAAGTFIVSSEERNGALYGLSRDDVSIGRTTGDFGACNGICPL